LGGRFFQRSQAGWISRCLHQYASFGSHGSQGFREPQTTNFAVASSIFQKSGSLSTIAFRNFRNAIVEREEAVLIGCMTAQTEHICGYGKQVLVVRECLCKGLCCRVGEGTFTPFSQAIPFGDRGHMRLFNNGSCIFRYCCYGGLEEIRWKVRRQGKSGAKEGNHPKQWHIAMAVAYITLQIELI
jgi:hypothetical protein